MKEVLYKNIDIWSQYSWVHGYEVGDYSDSIFPEYRTKGSGITVKVDIVEGREEALANMPQSVKGVPVRYIFAPRYELLMSGERAVHRPLVSGLRIESRTGDENYTNYVGGGTLGGLASLSDGTKVLFTNAHVMAGLGANDVIRNPTGDEMMFQGGTEWKHKVGSSVEWEELTDGQGENSNEVDLAYCVLDDDIDLNDMDRDDIGAVFKLHDSPHSNRSIVKGVKEPVSGLRVICLGMQTGPIWGTIERANEMPDTIGGRSFKNLFTVEFDVELTGGNSGSAILHELQPGVFQMVGILMARGRPGLFGIIGDRSNFGVCFPASAAQRALGLTFGHREPTAQAGYNQTVYVGDTGVELDGSRSRDPEDRGPLTYQWEQVISPPDRALSEDPEDFLVSLSDETAERPTFDVTVKPQTLEFKLTVTDVDGLSHSDHTLVTVENRPPVADAGEDAYVEVNTAAPLNGSGSSDADHQLDELSFNWQAPAESGVTILNPDHMETSFLAPSTAGDIEFTLTVTDPHEASATATVTKMVRVFTWSEWQDVDPIETRVSLLNPDEFEKKQFRTSDYGTTQYQWVPYSAPPPNGGQQDPPSGEDTSNGDTSGDTSGGDTSGDDTSGDDTSGDTSGGDTSGGDTSGDTSGDDTSDGDTSSGDTSGGDTSDGDTSSGDTSGGDTSDGDTSSGDTSGGDTSDGDTSSGDTSGGDTSDGDTSSGDTSGGDTSGGDTSSGDTSGDTSGDDTSDGDTSSDMSGGQQDPPPVSPSADAGSDQSVDYGERVDLNGIGSTPVGKLSFSWSESSSHGIILESADTAYPYFTAPETYAVITLQLTVTHTESSETATDSVTITVGSPPPSAPGPHGRCGLRPVRRRQCHRHSRWVGQFRRDRRALLQLGRNDQPQHQPHWRRHRLSELHLARQCGDSRRPTHRHRLCRTHRNRQRHHHGDRSAAAPATG